MPFSFPVRVIVLVGDNCEMFLQVGLSLGLITSMGYLNDKEHDLLESGIEWPGVTNK